MDNGLSYEIVEASFPHSLETCLCENLEDEKKNLKGEKIVMTVATSSLKDNAISNTIPVFFCTSDCSRRRKCSTMKKKKKI